MKPLIVDLNKYDNSKGQVYEGIKNSQKNFDGFGEVYFSEVLQGKTKGWKKHKRMQMNLIVISGEVTFYFFNELTGKGMRANASESKYRRIIIPPGLWVAFRGSGERNVICTIASIEYDPNEQVNVPLEEFELPNEEITENES